MVFKEILISLEKLSILNRRLYDVPIKWNPKSRLLSLNKRDQTKVFQIVSWGILILSCYTLGIVLINLFSSTPDPEFQTLTAVIACIILIGGPVSLVICHSIYFYNDDICFLCNQLWNITYAMHGGKQPLGGDNYLEGLLPNWLLGGIIANPLCAMVSPLPAVPTDPMYFILRLLAIPNIIKLIIRGILSAIVMFHVSYVYAWFLIVGFLAIRQFNNNLQILYQASLKLKRFANFSKTSVKPSVRKISPNEAFRIYDQIQILNQVINAINRYTSPFLLGLVVTLGSVFFYASICLYGEVGSVYMAFPILEMMILSCVAALFPELGSLHEQGEKFLGFWKNSQCSKFRRAKLESLKPLKINVGPFFYFKKSTYLMTMSTVIDYGISLIISSEGL